MEENAADLLPSLTAIGRALQDPFDPQRFLAEFSAHVQRFVPHDRLVIQYLEEGGMLSVFAEYAVRGPLIHQGRYTIDWDPASRRAPEDMVLGSVLAGESMIVQDFRTDRRFDRPGCEPLRGVQAGVRSRLAVPLISGGRVLGALLVTSYAPGTFSEDHARTVRHLADLVGPFIENTVLLHRERRRRERITALSRLGVVVGASLSPQERFGDLAEALRPHLDFDVIGMRLFEASGRELELVGCVGESPRLPQRIPLDHLSFLPRLLAGEPVLIRDASTELDPHRPGDRAMLEGGTRSSLAIPLVFGEKLEGFLFFTKWRPHWYDGMDVEIGTGIAAQLVVALQYQRLADEQHRRTLLEGRARELEQRLESLRNTLGDRYGFERIVGRAPALRDALDRAAKVALTETTVLLTGESGTGKELFARAIHYRSPRAAGPFVAINCAAIPETLVESELFGHERGAFTGADKQRPGRFEVAAAGTLFLDEVADLPPNAQAKLLRVLQEHEFIRVGGTATLRADVRVIAATNRDPERAVHAGIFREDLYYRLNVFQIRLPSLRERGGDDIVLLASHFAQEIGLRLGKGALRLSSDAQIALRAYSWPGNIRELENAIERALILTEEGNLLTAAHLGIGEKKPQTEAGGEDSGARAPERLAEVEQRTIRAALEYTKGNKTQAAALLGITRMQLRTRIKRLGLETG